MNPWPYRKDFEPHFRLEQNVDLGNGKQMLRATSPDCRSHLATLRRQNPDQLWDWREIVVLFLEVGTKVARKEMV